MSCLLKNARLRRVLCFAWIRCGEVKKDIHHAYMGVQYIHYTQQIPTSDVNALYISDGAVTGTSYVAESRGYINTSEVSLHKYVSNASYCEC